MRARIASLLASGTEIVAALGLADRLVAISHECDYPAEVLDRPRVSRPRFDPHGLGSAELDRAVRDAMVEHGSVYLIDGESLARLEPDLILAQAVCEVCAVPTPGAREVVERHRIGAEVLSLDAHTLEDIFQSILAVGRAAGVAERAARYVDGLRERLARVQAAVANEPAPRVLALEWLDPPFVPGHWVPEMVARAGGANLAGTAGAPSRQMRWEELAGLDPDVLIVMPCGYGLDAARADADRYAERLQSLAGRAIEARRAFVVDASSYFNRSGPRVVEGVEILAALLHPGRLAPAPAGTAQAWQPRR